MKKLLTYFVSALAFAIISAFAFDPDATSRNTGAIELGTRWFFYLFGMVASAGSGMGVLVELHKIAEGKP